MPSPPSQPQPEPAATGRTPAAFLSYTRFDDDYEHRWITRFREHLEKAVRAQGEPGFEVFKDTDGIEWGQKWEPRINDAIDSSTFFIPVMTPNFFQSIPCLKETDRFLKREAALNREVFLLPVLLRNCSSSRCDDDGARVRAALFAAQWRDWQELKFSTFDSPDVRRELEKMAERIQGVLAGAPAQPRSAVVVERPREQLTVGAGVAAADEITCEKDGAVMVRIPAGPFKMGSNEYDDEKPLHEVYLDEYYIDKHLVTNRRYKRFCDVEKREYPPDPGFGQLPDYFTRFPDHPVVMVSWDDAKAYCEWAGKRLPTEAEWEKAARGTDVRKYPWGNDEPDDTRCNFAGSRRSGPTRVGSYPQGASPHGVLDMAGNAWELCNDWYGPSYYAESQRRNPPGPASGSLRVLRGGSWRYRPVLLRCACRLGGGPSGRGGDVGFRCAVSG